MPGELLFILQNPIHIFSSHAADALKIITTHDQGHATKSRRCVPQQIRVEQFSGKLGAGGAHAYPLPSLPSSASVGVAHLCARKQRVVTNGGWKSEFLKLASKCPYVDRKISAKNDFEWVHLNFKPRYVVIADYKKSQKYFPVIDFILVLHSRLLVCEHEIPATYFPWPDGASLIRETTSHFQDRGVHASKGLLMLAVSD